MRTHLLNLSTFDLADDLESLGANAHTSVRRMLFLQWLRSRRSKCCGIYPKECSCCTGHENDPAWQRWKKTAEKCFKMLEVYAWLILHLCTIGPGYCTTARSDEIMVTTVLPFIIYPRARVTGTQLSRRLSEPRYYNFFSRVKLKKKPEALCRLYLWNLASHDISRPYRLETQNHLNLLCFEALQTQLTPPQKQSVLGPFWSRLDNIGSLFDFLLLLAFLCLQHFARFGGKMNLCWYLIAGSCDLDVAISLQVEARFE